MNKSGGRSNIPFAVFTGIDTDQEIFRGFISVMYCEGNSFFCPGNYGRAVFIGYVDIKKWKTETGGVRPPV